MTRTLLPLALVALLAACGSRTELRPGAGMTAVPKSEEAATPATPTQLMTPSSQARPVRSSDLLTRSEERAEDPFDLPPGPDNGKQGK